MQSIETAQDSGRERRAFKLRAGIATLLFAAATLWPLLDFGHRHDSVLHLFGNHGVNRTDSLAAVPLAGAIVVLLTPWRRRLPVLSCFVVAAVGCGIGVLLGLMTKVLM